MLSADSIDLTFLGELNKWFPKFNLETEQIPFTEPFPYSLTHIRQVPHTCGIVYGIPCAKIQLYTSQVWQNTFWQPVADSQKCWQSREGKILIRRTGFWKSLYVKRLDLAKLIPNVCPGLRKFGRPPTSGEIKGGPPGRRKVTIIQFISPSPSPFTNSLT